MNFKQIYFYTLRPVLLLFFASLFLDYVFGRERILQENIKTSVVLGLITGAIWFLWDKYRKKKTLD